MKAVLIALFVLQTFCAAAQKKLSLAAVGNVNVATKGLGLNDAGFGLAVAANALPKHALQPKVEAGIDRFIGDKLLALDANGNALNRNPAVWSTKAGVELFPASSYSLSAAYGLAHYSWKGETVNHGIFKAALAVYFGQGRKGLFALSYSALPNRGIRFFGLHAGFRFL